MNPDAMWQRPAQVPQLRKHQVGPLSPPKRGSGVPLLGSLSLPRLAATPPESPYGRRVERAQGLMSIGLAITVVMVMSVLSFTVFPKMSKSVDKDLLTELRLLKLDSQGRTAPEVRVSHHLPLRSLVLQHRQLMDFELYTPPHELLLDRAQRTQAFSQDNSRSRAVVTGSFPWRKVFIVANLYNNEDLVADFTASLGAYIRRGLLGMGLVGERGYTKSREGLYLRPEDVFVSVYSNANTDATPYLLRDVLVPELLSISRDYVRLHPQYTGSGLGFHVVPQGVPFCAKQRHGVAESGFTFNSEDKDTRQKSGAPFANDAFDRGLTGRAGKPEHLSRIQWLACLRNSAMLPLYVRGVEGLFSTATATGEEPTRDEVKWLRNLDPEYATWYEGKRPLRPASDNGFDAFLEDLYSDSSSKSESHRSRFIDVFVKADQGGHWWEMMGSHAYYSHTPFDPNGTGADSLDDGREDDALVLFFNDIFFYPWQVSHLVTPATTSTTVAGVGGSSASVSLDFGDRFDMTCAMDFYYNLYDTWVVRGIDGRPYSPYPPFARDHHSKGLLKAVLGREGVYNQIKNAAFYFKDEGNSAGHFPESYVQRGRTILESLLTTPLGGEPDDDGNPSRLGVNLPVVPVRSCWNGVVAIRASLFTRHGLKFRYPTPEEKERCPDSECKYIGEDIIDIRGRLLAAAALTASSAKASCLLRPASIQLNPLVQVSYEASFFEMFQGETAGNDVRVAQPDGSDEWLQLSWYVPPHDPIARTDARMDNSLLYRTSDSRSGGSKHWVSGAQVGAGRGGGLFWDWLLGHVLYDGVDEAISRPCLASSVVTGDNAAAGGRVLLCLNGRAAPPTLPAALWNTFHFVGSIPIRICCFVLDWSLMPVLRTAVVWLVPEQWTPSTPTTPGEWSRPTAERLLTFIGAAANPMSWMRHFYSSGFFFDFVSWLQIDGFGDGYVLGGAGTALPSFPPLGVPGSTAPPRLPPTTPLLVRVVATSSPSSVLEVSANCADVRMTQGGSAVMDELVILVVNYALAVAKDDQSLKGHLIRGMRLNTQGVSQCPSVNSVDAALERVLALHLWRQAGSQGGSDLDSLTILTLGRVVSTFASTSLNYRAGGADQRGHLLELMDASKPAHLPSDNSGAGGGGWRYLMPLNAFSVDRPSSSASPGSRTTFVRYSALSSSVDAHQASSWGKGIPQDLPQSFDDALRIVLGRSGLQVSDLSPSVFSLQSPSAMSCLWVTKTFNVKSSLASLSIGAISVLFLASLACATCLSMIIRRVVCSRRGGSTLAVLSRVVTLLRRAARTLPSIRRAASRASSPVAHSGPIYRPSSSNGHTYADSTPYAVTTNSESSGHHVVVRVGDV